jgi:uncharacterized repeat protein (TIGR03847 family)
MNEPQSIKLDQIEFITIDTIGPPGRRTFYLQAIQQELIITVIIEKEHASAIAIAIESVLEQLGIPRETPQIAGMDLIQPVQPLFRVGQLRLGYDQERDMLIISAEALTQGAESGAIVQIWVGQELMEPLAHKAAAVVAAGRPTCPLCHEIINPDEEHVCVRENGKKKIFTPDGT